MNRQVRQGVEVIITAGFCIQWVNKKTPVVCFRVDIAAYKGHSLHECQNCGSQPLTTIYQNNEKFLDSIQTVVEKGTQNYLLLLIGQQQFNRGFNIATRKYVLSSLISSAKIAYFNEYETQNKLSSDSTEKYDRQFGTLKIQFYCSS